MQTADIRTQWEGAAPGWARWEATVATWMEPATEAMLTMAGVNVGARVLDLASGAGSQTLQAARRVGAQGHVVASDIADAMLHHVQENARAAGLAHVTPLAGAAEDLDVAAASLVGSGFVAVAQRTLALPLRMPSAAQALAMMQEAFGASRAVVSDRPESVRVTAWAEVAETLTTFETPTGLVAPAEVLVAAGVKPV